MVKAKGGPIAADGLYGEWQSPFPTLPACQISLASPLPPPHLPLAAPLHPPGRRAAATANTITLSESKRNSPFDDVAYLSKIELPATESRLLSFDPGYPLPGFVVVQRCSALSASSLKKDKLLRGENSQVSKALAVLSISLDLYLYKPIFVGSVAIKVSSSRLVSMRKSSTFVVSLYLLSRGKLLTTILWTSFYGLELS